MGSRRNSHHPSAEGLFNSIKEEIPSTNPLTIVEEKAKEKRGVENSMEIQMPITRTNTAYVDIHFFSKSEYTFPVILLDKIYIKDNPKYFPTIQV